MEVRGNSRGERGDENALRKCRQTGRGSGDGDEAPPSVVARRHGRAGRGLSSTVQPQDGVKETGYVLAQPKQKG